MELVEKYQRTVEQGRGKITAYLDSYKSKYRMELQEPVKRMKRCVSSTMKPWGKHISHH